ncbi:unnamed protein product [Chrysodeixis includens]|uniref:Uncharacterized protein n=1 Tax=Chrysodeixis includens TaxID=689277 RepID=A0A9N8L6C7_CHRIL|nr:unnamed protein product [Chrysodeixis includens]
MCPEDGALSGKAVGRNCGHGLLRGEQASRSVRTPPLSSVVPELPSNCRSWNAVLGRARRRPRAPRGRRRRRAHAAGRAGRPAAVRRHQPGGGPGRGAAVLGERGLGQHAVPGRGVGQADDAGERGGRAAGGAGRARGGGAVGRRGHCGALHLRQGPLHRAEVHYT